MLYQGHIDYIDEINDWHIPIFPVNGDMIAKLGVPKGPIFSKIIYEVKEIWKNEYNFNADEKTLLDRALVIFKQFK